tara:strand:+ start:317 stop:1342 length:1026 start_codon:yes stop_codon:yes gene_type:complete
MANNLVAHQPNDFGVGIVLESDIGTPEDNTTQLFTDSVSLPSFAPDQDLSAKSGMFVADEAHIHSSQKNTPSEITMSGLLNDTVLGLLEGIFHTAAGTNVITVADSYTAPNLYHGLSTAAATRTYTVKLLSPTLTDTESSPNTAPGCIELTGCCPTALSISGDAGSDGGRLKYSLTMKTGYAPVFAHAAGTISAPTTNGLQNIHDLTYRTIAGVASPVMQSFSVNIENPVDYVGWDAVNSRPYTISRSVPEGPIVTMSAAVKLDYDTRGLLANFMNDTAQTGLINNLGNHSGQAAAKTADTNWAMHCTKAIITGMSLNEQAAMMYNVEQKLLFGSLTMRNT